MKSFTERIKLCVQETKKTRSEWHWMGHISFRWQ